MQVCVHKIIYLYENSTEFNTLAKSSSNSLGRNTDERDISPSGLVEETHIYIAIILNKERRIVLSSI